MKSELKPEIGTPLKAVGVDEWAVRLGHRYGTIVVDLERRRPVAVLADREVRTVADYLSQHPQVEVVSRDRSGGYAEAATQGAPQAIQVADKFHLLKNLGEAVEEFLLLQGKRNWLRGVADGLAASLELNPASAELELPSLGTLEYGSIAAGRKQATLKTQQQRYQLIKELGQQNLSMKEIALQSGLGVTTVWRYLQMSEPPSAKPVARRAHHVLAPYESYLVHRYNEGCRKPDVLVSELRAKGVKVSRATIWRFFTELNRTRLTTTPSEGATNTPHPATKKRQAQSDATSTKP